MDQLIHFVNFVSQGQLDFCHRRLKVAVRDTIDWEKICVFIDAFVPLFICIPQIFVSFYCALGAFKCPVIVVVAKQAKCLRVCISVYEHEVSSRALRSNRP